MTEQTEHLWRDVPAGVPCWHIHDTMLLEWSTEPLESRAEYIRRNKPRNEIETRLRLMRPVTGGLPKEVVEAGRAHNEARRAYNEACWTYMETWCTYGAHGKAARTHKEPWRVCAEAWCVYEKTLERHSSEIEKLHEEECPNCPWDGKGETIFPG